MKRLLRMGAGFLAAAALLVTVLSLWLYRASLGGGPSGDLPLRGLDAPVTVTFDRYGIPTVEAGSELDAFRAQGWLHARDRLWQMELFRRVAEGRLSEVLGEQALESDRFLRTLGMRRAADRGVEVLAPEVRRVLDAYVEGVNAALATWEGPLPPEFLLLRIRPEPWSAGAVVAMEKIMAWDLADYQETLALARARPRLDEAGWSVVRPAWPADGLTILEDGPGPVGAGDPGARGIGGAPGGAGIAEPSPVAPAGVSGRLLDAARPPALAAALLEAGGAVRASNSWVLSGSRSRSGKPILANDMHLGLNVPTLWYLVSLQAPGLQVAGMSLPGGPGIVAGRTRGVAWGFTNAYVDDADLFVERVDPADSTRYLVPGGSEPFEVRTELIRVRGRAVPDTLRVRETRHGPVITGVASVPGEDLLALRWAGHDPTATLGALLEVNRAADAGALLSALRDFRNPHQNVVFADTAGTFGYRMAGRVPRRRGGAPPPLPVPGWTGEHEWDGDVPFDAHPGVLEPERGYVVTANNRQGWDPVSARISGGSWASPDRAERIRQGILAVPLHDTASTRLLQMDLRDPFALRHRDRAARAFREAGAPSRAELLERWDGDTSAGRIEPTLFYRWAGAFRARAARAVYADPAGGYFPWEAWERYLGVEQPRLLREMAREAAREVADEEPRPWGEVHRLVLEHPLSAVPVIGGIAGFHRGAYAVGGSRTTVNVAAFSAGAGDPPLEVRNGASQRHVTDLADPEGIGWFVLPGGQSGLPRNAHALDQLPLWLEGRLVPLATGAVGAHGAERRTLRLLPSADVSP